MKPTSRTGYRTGYRTGWTLALLGVLALPVAAQDTTRAAMPTENPTEPTVTLPLKPARTVRFTTDEGTWMSVDVSPDGRTLVFDLAGDLYTLPIGGGRATRISSGMAFDAQPRFSPDGRHLVFVSDRNGSENLWVADADGRNPRQITRLEKRQFVSPEWTPDGRYLVVSQNSGLFGAQYDLVLINRDGGTGVKMTGNAPAGATPNPFAPTPPNNHMGASFGPDGRYVYVATRQGAGGYNQTSFGWQVSSYDRETGRIDTRTSALGGGMRPAVSPDGRWLVYGTRVDSATGLRLRDLRSGDEGVLLPRIQRDDQESRFTRDLLPGMSWTPDNRSVVLAFDGKLWRAEVPSGRLTPIPFTAEVEQGMGALSKFEYRVNDSTLTVGQVRGARPSPDGKRVAFTALDKVWVMELPSGTPRRLTRSGGQLGEHSPTWSPDGRFLAYVTWTEEGGDVMRVRADGRGPAEPERLSRSRAFYENPAYTPDGTRLVLARGPRQPRIEASEFGSSNITGMELVYLPGAGGEARVIAPLSFGARPHFTREDSERVYLYDRSDGLQSMRFDGTDRKSHLRVTGYVDARSPTPRPTPADEVQMGPDGDRALVEADNHIFVVDVPRVGGQAPTVSVVNPQAATVPVKRLTRIGGEFSGWHRDGKKVFYSIGRSFFTYDLVRADSLVRDSTMRADSAKRVRPTMVARDTARADTARTGMRPGEAVALTRTDSVRVARTDTARSANKPVYEPARTDVLITVPRDLPRGVVALRNARFITMKGAEVIERGDLVVRDNRIVAVGPAGSVTIPAGAREFDLAGKTVMPGWVDIHAHIWPAWGIHRTQVWEYLANLAYGVTTTRDPQTATTDVLSYGDLVETGDILGPRVFSTGPGVFWSDDIRSLDDARDVLRRYSEFYNTHTIKQYMVGDRKVRQWVIMAARELGITPTLEGGLDYKKNLTEALDGYAGSEHSYPIAPLFRDNTRLIAESGITYTPTLLVQYGGPWAENFWYQQYDITRDAKLRRFTPIAEINRRALRRPGWWHPSQYSFSLQAEQAAKIVREGGRVGLGGHGQLQGLGVHWELWSIASGGMPAHDVLRVGTIFGADAIGLGRDLGSLEPGKLADLQVLDANPLENIRNSNSVRMVMKNGRLYDAESLAELYPRQRSLGPLWWQRPAAPLPVADQPGTR